MLNNSKFAVTTFAVCIFAITSNTTIARDADRTRYPVVFAHGLAGFDNILGFDYWGDDYGTFVLDPCDRFFEFTCNPDIDTRQQSYISAVQPLHNSEVRGHQLADNIESYMATSGSQHVNLVSHSMGGIDGRKAAKLLQIRKGYQVVKTHISISSPHRGSPVAKYVLDNFRNTVVESLANIYGNIVYAPGNDAIEAAKQLVYEDYENDGKLTGVRDFNQRYPATGAIAHAASVLTAQNGLRVNPALWLLSEGFYDIDGNGFCNDDCDGDGAAGAGDGLADERDDDGLVGINSQQQGARLYYQKSWWDLDTLYSTANYSTGVVTDLNRPNEIQMTSLAYVLNQDHLDVIGIGPDTFDEMEFYAAIVDYIAGRGH